MFNAAAYLKLHSITIVSDNGATLNVVEQSSINGVAHSEIVTINADLQSVRDWLGY